MLAMRAFDVEMSRRGFASASPRRPVTCARGLWRWGCRCRVPPRAGLVATDGAELLPQKAGRGARRLAQGSDVVGLVQLGPQPMARQTMSSTCDRNCRRRDRAQGDSRGRCRHCLGTRQRGNHVLYNKTEVAESGSIDNQPPGVVTGDADVTSFVTWRVVPST